MRPLSVISLLDPNPCAVDMVGRRRWQGAAGAARRVRGGARLGGTAAGSHRPSKAGSWRGEAGP
jgi:hypothetical protein